MTKEAEEKNYKQNSAIDLFLNNYLKSSKEPLLALNRLILGISYLGMSLELFMTLMRGMVRVLNCCPMLSVSSGLPLTALALFYLVYCETIIYDLSFSYSSIEFIFYKSKT